MTLSDILPDADQLLALEPEELAPLILPIFDAFDKRRERPSPENIVNTAMGARQHPAQAPTMGGLYPERQRDQIEEAVREAWTWLFGAGLLLNPPPSLGDRPMLSRRARQIASEPDPRRALSGRKIPKDALHASIREDVWSLFHRGKYDTAVFEALKAVEVAVRRVAGLTDRDLGVGLMRKAFDKTNGPLTDMSMEEGEREARAHFFAGAIGSYKNPHSHRNVALDDSDEAAEIIMLANHLLRIVDARAAVMGVP